MELKEKLAVLREKQGLSQGEIAEKINVSRQAVYKWERGTAVPSTENLILLGELYGISLDELVNRDLEETSGGVAVAVEAEADSPTWEKTPTKRRNWWRGVAVCLAVLLVTVIIVYSVLLHRKGQETPKPLPMEDMEWEDIDPAEVQDWTDTTVTIEE